MTCRFDFIRSRSYRTMISKTYNAVCEIELWKWLENYELFSENLLDVVDQSNRNNKKAAEIFKLLRLINDELVENYNIDYSDSIIYILHEMQYIARYGLQKYKEKIVLREM